MRSTSSLVEIHNKCILLMGIKPNIGFKQCTALKFYYKKTFGKSAIYIRHKIVQNHIKFVLFYSNTSINIINLISLNLDRHYSQYVIGKGTFIHDA